MGTELAFPPDAAQPEGSALQDLLDYRWHLREYYRVRRASNARFSWRLLARRMRLDVGHVHRVLHGRSHFHPDKVPQVAEGLGLGSESSRLLDLLVRFGRSRCALERAGLLEEILAGGGRSALAQAREQEARELLEAVDAEEGLVAHGEGVPDQQARVPAG